MPLILQSGKSAAIYACAKEQGIKVLEVMKVKYACMIMQFPIVGECH